jgi:hypothetical protein
MQLSRDALTALSKLLVTFPDTMEFSVSTREDIDDYGCQKDVLDIEMMQVVNGFLAKVRIEIEIDA